MTYSIVCPYCSHAIKVMDYDEGYQAVVCTVCNKPFVNQTTMTPVFHSFALVGFDSPKVHDVDEYYRDDVPTQEEIEEDAKYYAEHPEEFDEISESMKIPLTDETINDVRKWANVLKCVECGKPVSPDSDWRLCEDCLKDDEPEQVTANSAFLKCPLSKNSLYRLDGDHIEVKYIKGAAIRTTWSDVYMMCEEENPTATIKELLGERANTNNVAAVNAFVRAVKGGLIEADA